MKPPREFFEALPTRKTQEIVDALARSREYEPEAVEAFRAELIRRGVEPGTLEGQVDASRAWFAPKDEKAVQPLEWPLRILCCLVLGPLLLLILWSFFRKQGYERKAREIIEWTAYGFSFWCILYLIGRIVAHFKVYE
jgi:hypothetical protein